MTKLPLLVLFILHVWLQITVWSHLLSVWMAFFGVFCKASLRTTDLWVVLCFFTSGKVFHLHFFEDSFSGYRILGWQFFFFKTPEYFFPLTSSIVSAEKSSVNIIGVHCKWWDFHLLFSRFSSFFWLSAFLLWSLCVYPN